MFLKLWELFLTTDIALFLAVKLCGLFRVELRIQRFVHMVLMLTVNCF